MRGNWEWLPTGKQKLCKQVDKRVALLKHWKQGEKICQHIALHQAKIPFQKYNLKKTIIQTKLRKIIARSAKQEMLKKSYLAVELEIWHEEVESSGNDKHEGKYKTFSFKFENNYLKQQKATIYREVIKGKIYNCNNEMGERKWKCCKVLTT